jgi:translation initiation factor 4A
MMTTHTQNDLDNYIIRNWEDENLNLSANLLRGIYAFGFEKPSPIQCQALMPMISNKNRDIIAQAQSGTGKTGAFVISVLQKLCNSDYEKVDSTFALILAPTHELASQSMKVFSVISKFMKPEVRIELLVGGTSIEDNKNNLIKNKPHIVVGTPGRIQDMLRRKHLKVDKLNVIVIDEADEMFSSGFQEQVYKIFQYMPQEIQIGLFSATMDNDLEELSTKFMMNPKKILVKSQQLTLQGIAQYYINMDDDMQKYETLKDLFGSLTISQAIIYCNSTKRVDDLEEAMREDDFPVRKIHGKMRESERKNTYQEFKKGGCRVLITSNLFARGIDVQQVSIVINFDIPKNEHTYLHRIGRSGRWGRKGIAINFQTKYDIARLKKFEEFYDTEIIEMPANYTDHLNI